MKMHAAVSVFCLAVAPLFAIVTGAVRGLVTDPDHRAIAGAGIVIKSATSDFSRTAVTKPDGTFELPSVPVGLYRITASEAGFQPAAREIVVVSGSAREVNFQLALGPVREEVTVTDAGPQIATEQITPTTVLTRNDIAATPGADLTNSLQAIAANVPGAYVTHDQLHIRGGHQVSWALDGVPIPNTNIASNIGPQIDPKDIDYLETQRGGYSAAYGDRTYAVFNAVPRTGFEGNNFADLLMTFGTFHQTNGQLSLGSHTEKFAYYGSLAWNRSDYGLETPGPDVLHDRVWGIGGMGTLIYNRNERNQFRFVTLLRRDDYQVPVPLEGSGVSAVERERDGVASLSWLHTLPRGMLLTVSPFFHENRANYDGGPGDFPINAAQHRDSRYAGAQVSLAALSRHHSATAGTYGFFQRDDELVSLLANDGSGLSVHQRKFTNGGLLSGFLEDRYKPFSWLTLTGGVRLTHFHGVISEGAADPRVGAALRIPLLNWTVRGFWGRYYQAPPLSTVSGPLLNFAIDQGLAFIPLHGERDREIQFGLAIPLRLWSIEINHYNQRASNYFDHNSIGNSNIFFPLTIAGARLRGWEFSIRSPHLYRRVTVNFAYAIARAEGVGSVTGGLIDFSPPESGVFLLDHDQRHTFHTGFSAQLPFDITVGGNLYYGSGFTDGESTVPAHLPGHTTFDASVSKQISEGLSLSVTALNAANRRFLLDNSPTFGGTHYADPRQIYVQVRYRFHY